MHREVGPLSPVAYLTYAAFANAVMALALFIMFRDVLWRNQFLVVYNLLSYNLCFALLLLTPRPIDSFLRDIANIQPGVSLPEAERILQPWRESGALREVSRIHVSRYDEDIIGYDSPGIGSFQLLFVTVKQGRVQSAVIHWD